MKRPEAEEKTPDPLNSSSAPDILIHGRVADEAGTPVAGAKLWLPVKLEDDDRLAKATTDEAGRFTLRVPADWIESEAFPMPRVIWCYATKHQIAVAPASNQLTGGSDEPIEIVLKPSTDTRFEVKNLQGDPIRGAWVEPGLFLERAAREIAPAALREVVGAETNDRGVALLPALGRGDFPQIRVTAPGYGVQELRLRDSAEGPAVRTVRLSPTGRLEGRLLCDDPSAFKGLRVCIDTDQPRRSDEVAVAAGFAEVDEKGRFVFPECAEGPIRLLIPIVEPGAWAPRVPKTLKSRRAKRPR